MHGPHLTLVGGIVGMLLTVATLGFCSVRSLRRLPTTGGAQRRRSITVSAVGSVILGAALVVAICATPPLAGQPQQLGLPLVGHQLALLPLVALAVVLLVNVLAEVTWPRPRGSRRHAALADRTIRSITSVAEVRFVLVALAALIAVAALVTLASSGPRTITRLVDATTAHTMGPFPGWLWTVPLIVLATGAVGLMLLTLRLVALRPVGEDTDPAWDAWWRRRSARQLLRMTFLVLGLTMAGLIGVAGIGLRLAGSGNPGTPPGPQSVPSQVAGDVLQLLCLAVGLMAVAITVRPTRDPAPAPGHVAMGIAA